MCIVYITHMSTKEQQQHLIDIYVSELLEATGIAQLPEDQRSMWSKQLGDAMHKAVTVAFINALSVEGRQKFENYLSHKEIAKAMKVLVDENTDYETKMKEILEQYNKNFLERYLQELKKQ